MLSRGEDIYRWAETAEPGAQATYYRGERPPLELVKAMAPLRDAGVIHPKTKREGREFLFLVERGTAPMSAADRRRAARGFVRRRSVQRSSLSMVLQCLTAAAVAGRPCPSLEELAKRCGLSGKCAAQYRVRRLIEQGRILVEDRGPLVPRVVTILTGRHAGKATRSCSDAGARQQTRRSE